MIIRTPDEKRAASLHEAAHAIIGAITGWSIEEVTLNPRPGRSGAHVTANASRVLPRFCQECAMLMAGGMAPIFEASPQRYLRALRASAGDWQMICDCFERVYGYSPEADDRRVTHCLAETEQLLSEFWEPIRHLAALLEKHNTLPGSTVQAVLDFYRGQ